MKTASDPSPWSAYEPTREAPWNLRRVVHLHRRAGFAATWGEIQRDVWYNAAGNLVAATQLGSDGSKIRQTLISDPAGSRETKPEAAKK